MQVPTLNRVGTQHVFVPIHPPRLPGVQPVLVHPQLNILLYPRLARGRYLPSGTCCTIGQDLVQPADALCRQRPKIEPKLRSNACSFFYAACYAFKTPERRIGISWIPSRVFFTETYERKGAFSEACSLAFLCTHCGVTPFVVYYLLALVMPTVLLRCGEESVCCGDLATVIQRESFSSKVASRAKSTRATSWWSPSLFSAGPSPS